MNQGRLENPNPWAGSSQQNCVRRRQSAGFSLTYCWDRVSLCVWTERKTSCLRSCPSSCLTSCLSISPLIVRGYLYLRQIGRMYMCVTTHTGTLSRVCVFQGERDTRSSPIGLVTHENILPSCLRVITSCAAEHYAGQGCSEAHWNHAYDPAQAVKTTLNGTRAVNRQNAQRRFFHSGLDGE